MRTRIGLATVPFSLDGQTGIEGSLFLLGRLGLHHVLHSVLAQRLFPASNLASR
jgi:hypothetical protein